jgi:uncharacterized protein
MRLDHARAEPPSNAMGPIDSDLRIAALDAVRGFALLGILWANVRQMFLPFDAGSFAVALDGGERWAWLDWQLFHALVDLKFLTLFSLLFGVSFALQFARLNARGQGFTRVYVRRVVILALFGLAHGLLLYSAEVLFAYAVAGLVLLALRDWPAARLLEFGLILLGITLIWGYQIGSLGSVSLVITLVSGPVLAAVVTLLRQRSWPLALTGWVAVLIAAAAVLTLRFAGSNTEDSLASEYRAAQEQLAAIAGDTTAGAPEEWRVRQAGDFGALLGLHAEQYAQLLVYLVVFLLWRTLGLFMIGAGLFRSGLITRLGHAGWARVALIGLGLGLPLSILATWLTGRELVGLMDWRWPEFLHTLSALPLAAGLAALVFVLRERPRQRWLWLRVEAAGRIALSNYIGQSVVIATLAEFWGFGLYGHLNGVEMTATAIVVFALLAEASYVWLQYFRLGPLEWLWRCGTYWRWLPNRLVAA